MDNEGMKESIAIIGRGSSVWRTQGRPLSLASIMRGDLDRYLEIKGYCLRGIFRGGVSPKCLSKIILIPC